MKNQQHVALVCGGPVSRSGLARLSGLRDQLAWVKASTPSAASRAANILGGRAVREYADLQNAGIILVRAPDSAVAGIVAEMREAEFDWTEKIVVLFETGLDSTSLQPLAFEGALVASLNQVDAVPDCLLLEGTTEARKRIRRLLTRGRHSLIELDTGGKSHYLRAVQACTTGFMPIVAEAVDGFRRAGMEKAAAQKSAALLFENSLRAYLRAGKRLLKRSASARA